MLEKLIPEEVREAEQLFHGDMVLEKASEYGISENQLIDFSTNVNPIGPPASVLEAIEENLDRVSKYPPQDPDVVREDLAEYSGSSREKIVLGNGSNELIYLLARIFLQSKDGTVVAEPTFTEYSRAARIQGSEVNSVRLEEEKDFELEVEEFEEEISDEVNLAFICSPNNPTGRMLSENKLERLLDICGDHDTLLVVDEAFYEYCESPKKFNIVEMESENLISIRSLTKFYSLPGLRVGYLIAPEYLAEALRKAKIRWNVNILAQIAVREALNVPGFVSKTKKVTREGKDYLQKNLKKFSGIKVYPTDANFFLINLDKTDINSSRLIEMLLEKGIALRDCSDYKYLDDNFVRVNIRPVEDCRKLIESLREINSDGLLEKD